MTRYDLKLFDESRLPLLIEENLSSRVFALYVGGREFKTTLATMVKYPSSALGAWQLMHCLQKTKRTPLDSFWTLTPICFTTFSLSCEVACRSCRQDCGLNCWLKPSF